MQSIPSFQNGFKAPATCRMAEEGATITTALESLTAVSISVVAIIFGGSVMPGRKC
ncbi:hypothetical protein D3C87_1652960 [compost metagenome]